MEDLLQEEARKAFENQIWLSHNSPRMTRSHTAVQLLLIMQGSSSPYSMPIYPGAQDVAKEPLKTSKQIDIII